jgi:hypothetical protein
MDFGIMKERKRGREVIYKRREKYGSYQLGSASSGHC